jgi:hypothetical protein
MKHIKKMAVAAFLLLAVNNITTAQLYKANVPVVSQQQNQWCWDANSKCILNYYGYTVTQCAIAEYVRTIDPGTFGNTNCCSSPSGKCNSPNYLAGASGVQGVLKHFGNIESNPLETIIPITKITDELGAKRPFILLIIWSSGGGHVVVGCQYNTGTSYITFMDPWQNNGMTTCKHTNTGTAIVTASGTGTWAETLVVLTPYVTTGMDQIAAINSITVFPNPSAGELNITSDDQLKVINIFNTTGQLIDSYIINSDKSYSLKLPAAGLYNLQVITTNGLVNKKVIVK